MVIASNKIPKAKLFVLGSVDNIETAKQMTVEQFAASAADDVFDLQDIQAMLKLIRDSGEEAPDMPQHLVDALESAAESEGAPANLLALAGTKWEQLVNANKNSADLISAINDAKAEEKQKRSEEAKRKKAESEKQAEKKRKEKEEMESRAKRLKDNAIEVATSNSGQVKTLDNSLATGLPEGVSVDVETGVTKMPKSMSDDELYKTLTITLQTKKTTGKLSDSSGWLIGDTLNRLKKQSGDTMVKTITTSGMLEAFGVTYGHLERMAKVASRFDNSVRAKCSGLTFTHFQEAAGALPKTDVEAKEMSNDIIKGLKKIAKGQIHEKPNGEKVSIIGGAQATVRPMMKELREKYGLAGGNNDPKANFTIIAHVDGEIMVTYAEELDASHIKSLKGKGAVIIDRKMPSVLDREGGVETIKFVKKDDIPVAPSDEEDGED